MIPLTRRVVRPFVLASSTVDSSRQVITMGNCAAKKRRMAAARAQAAALERAGLASAASDSADSNLAGSDQVGALSGYGGGYGGYGYIHEEECPEGT